MGVWWLVATHVVLTSAANTPTSAPTLAPTLSPTLYPSPAPTESPSLVPTIAPTTSPTNSSTTIPTTSPTTAPTTTTPTTSPTRAPTTVAPTRSPTYKSYPCLTQTLVTKMIRSITTLINSAANIEDQASLLGGIVRLTFHDAGTFSLVDNSGGPDGCVDMTDIDNRGLDKAINALQPLYDPYSSRISRADFWHLAGVTAVAVAQGPTIPWRYGRRDCPGYVSPQSDRGRLPQSALGWAHVMEVFETRMGFSDQDVVALLGAHTLGRLNAQNSGMDGRWELGSSPAIFDNQFFLSLSTVDWHKVSNSYPKYGFPSTTQWNQLGVPTVYPEQMFLTTDIGLMVSNANESGCKQATFTVTQQPLYPGCIKNTRTFGYVMQFASSQDAFFQAFISAYQKMQELGYSEGTLLNPGQCFPGALVVDDGTLAPTTGPPSVQYNPGSASSTSIVMAILAPFLTLLFR